jgi:RimJ/RimL family protein N-acetyltransferase
MPEPTRGPAYRIETPRLVLRCYQPTDAPLLQAAIDSSLDELRPWMPWAWHEPVPVLQKAQLLRQFRGMFDHGQDYVYGIFSPDEKLVLGSTGLHPRLGAGAREIGYWIRAGHTGQGLATELAAALTRVGFEIERLHRVEIHCAPDNLRSARVPEKLGYTHEATLRQRVARNDGTLRDSMIWSLLAAEYPTSPAAAVPIRAFDLLGEPLL